MGKRKRQEELLKTHVINLNEIRKAEQSEKQMKLEKTVIILIIIGMFSLTTGIGINIYNNNIKEKSVAVNR